MKKLALTILAAGLTLPLAFEQPAMGQTAVLFDLYGRGVHAYYAGQPQSAYDKLSMAIDNGMEDPRAYYFRGIAASSMGRIDQAQSDWEEGAKLEARGKMAGAIGQSLARFQGPQRLQLEAIRQQAKVEFLAEAASRSKARFGEILSDQGDVLRGGPAPPTVTTTPAVPSAVEDPFADDLGTPSLDSDDALEGALQPPPSQSGVAPPGGGAVPVTPSDSGPGSSDPFGGGGGDPFGGGGADPFGGGAAEDPFGGDGGGDPFGGDGGGDPFGGTGDPFGDADSDPFGR